ncbi:hypothetical protein GCM10020260_04650 [Nesterenkonia halobia]|uniref:PKD domain-containing protein n=1 Tax=Nesterenkonia halobia TaxID=37922 RepID=A0ABP6R9Y2_9MICC
MRSLLIRLAPGFLGTSLAILLCFVAPIALQGVLASDAADKCEYKQTAGKDDSAGSLTGGAQECEAPATDGFVDSDEKESEGGSGSDNQGRGQPEGTGDVPGAANQPGAGGAEDEGDSGEEVTYEKSNTCLAGAVPDSACIDLNGGPGCTAPNEPLDVPRRICETGPEPEPEQDEQSADPEPVTVAREEFVEMSLEPASVQFEPDLLGFGYKGRHTNIYADVGTQTTSGEVLDATMELRAIPVAYHWDYGDGTSRTTYEPGEPLPDYDGTGEEINTMDFKTPTSHVYEETGIFEVTVTTEFVGQFRYDGGDWDGIPGTISVTSSPGEADIWTQNSRWVSGACESRDQWGCNGPVQFDPSTDRPPKIYQDQYDENGNWIGPVN